MFMNELRSITKIDHKNHPNIIKNTDKIILHNCRQYIGL
jgi:hypothetical protein